MAAIVLGTIGAAMAGEEAGGNTHRGVEVAIDLPMVDHVRNTGGTDGAGLCVWASLQMCANWEAIEELDGGKLFARMKTKPGGGWPERVDRELKEIAPGVPFVQYEGPDEAILDAAIESGRPVGVTYGYGDLYGGQTIAHMVALVHLDKDLAAVIDNNDPDHFTWMARSEFLKRWRHPSGNGWAVVLLRPGPPPPARN